MAEPIKPSEVASLKQTIFPSVVIEVVNQLITEKFNNGTAHVKQEDIVNRIVANSNYSREEIFSNGWLNVEDIYRRNVWSVEYDKPGYNESYVAYFVFSSKG